ncbi:MAG: tripartite tricarboxylate transporter substrate-binding protein [Lachnospiraceae bacterium]|nr:tripartite tricarboxylate transporter substrate-binding protein [Lachnospiraceae bacterium]
MMKKVFATAAVALTACLATTGIVAASDAAWPSAAVQFSVPAKAGGVTDIYTRYVQAALQEDVGGTYSTVNYDTPAVAYQTVVAATDANTLLFQHMSLVTGYVTGSLAFDPTTEYRVAGVPADMGTQAVIVGPDAPYSTWDELVAYCKEHPGDVSCAIATNGSTHFIFGMAQQKCDIELNMVECASEADKLTNVAGGIIDLANCSLGNALQYEEAGKIKVLGVVGSEKVEGYDQWEPIPDIAWTSPMFVFASKDVSDEELEAINAALKTVSENEAFIEGVTSIGGTASWYSVEDSQKMFDEAVKTCTEIAEGLGIYGLG